MVKRQISGNKQTYNPAITDLFGTITAVVQSYQHDSKKVSNNLELGVLIDAEIKRSKNNANTTEQVSAKDKKKTLTEKISETTPEEKTEKDELTTLPGRFSNTLSFSYQLPEQESIDHRTIFAYKPEQKVQMYTQETDEKENVVREIQTISPEVIRRMTVQKISERAPEYSFLKKYVSPEDQERYEMYRQLNRAQADRMEVGKLMYGIFLN